jgi:hypothetical protein
VYYVGLCIEILKLSGNVDYTLAESTMILSFIVSSVGDDSFIRKSFTVTGGADNVFLFEWHSKNPSTGVKVL